MSHIFDALQISEAARTGNKHRRFLSVTELLERAELRDAARRLSESIGAEGAEALPCYEEPSAGESPTVGGIALAEEVDSPHRVPETDFFERIGSVDITLSSCPYLAAVNDKHGPAAEAFRLLGTRLNQLRHERGLRRLLITSTGPQEGKTFTAANLACAFPTRTQERIVVVDGDLRRASLSRMFELGAFPGVCEWLRGDNELSSAILRLNGTDIWVMPTGTSSANPLELIESARLPALIDELSARFDWIIIDSPPVLPLADTSAWARLTDGILLVTRPGTTEKRKLQATLEALDAQKLIGAILNTSHFPSAADYGYYANPKP